MTVDELAGGELHVYTDGASRGNPGPAAGAYVFATPGGEQFHADAAYLGETTNNRAEYRAIALALSEAAEVHSGPVVLHSDSELVVKQLTGEYRVRSAALQPLYEEVRSLVGRFDSVSVRHVPRENDLLAEADRRANEVLDER